MQRIGLSTGMIFKSMPDSDLGARVNMLAKLPYPINSPALPIELHIAHPEQLAASKFEALKSALLWACNRIFWHELTIHAPTEITYPSAQAEDLVPKIQELAAISRARTIVFHPTDVSDPAWLSATFPTLAAIENMDISKRTGRTPSELERFRDNGLRFVLDLNHAATHGPEAPQLITSLLEFAGNNLAHAHISGFELHGNPHSLYHINGTVSQADLIHHLPSHIPLIHEGVLDAEQSGKESELIAAEMALLGSNISL